MMVAVAVFGFFLGMVVRRQRFLGIAAWHRSEVNQLDGGGRMDILPWPESARSVWIPSPKHAWHGTMQAKYERAARYPWLPIESDPPEPK